MICAVLEQHLFFFFLSLSLVRLSPLQGMPSSSFSSPRHPSLLGNTHLSGPHHRNLWLLQHPAPFRTQHSLFGCLQLSTQLSSHHCPPPTSNLSPGLTLCFPSWIHRLLGYAGPCHLDWITPLRHSASTLILPPIYSEPHRAADRSFKSTPTAMPVSHFKGFLPPPIPTLRMKS